MVSYSHFHFLRILCGLTVLQQYEYVSILLICVVTNDKHYDGHKHIEQHDVAVVEFCAECHEASMSMAFTNDWVLFDYFLY